MHGGGPRRLRQGCRCTVRAHRRIQAPRRTEPVKPRSYRTCVATATAPGPCSQATAQRHSRLPSAPAAPGSWRLRSALLRQDSRSRLSASSGSPFPRSGRVRESGCREDLGHRYLRGGEARGGRERGRGRRRSVLVLAPPPRVPVQPMSGPQAPTHASPRRFEFKSPAADQSERRSLWPGSAGCRGRKQCFTNRFAGDL